MAHLRDRKKASEAGVAPRREGQHEMKMKRWEELKKSDRKAF